MKIASLHIKTCHRSVGMANTLAALVAMLVCFSGSAAVAAASDDLTELESFARSSERYKLSSSNRWSRPWRYPMVSDSEAVLS